MLNIVRIRHIIINPNTSYSKLIYRFRGKVNYEAIYYGELNFKKNEFEFFINPSPPHWTYFSVSHKPSRKIVCVQTNGIRSKLEEIQL